MFLLSDTTAEHGEALRAGGSSGLAGKRRDSVCESILSNKTKELTMTCLDRTAMPKEYDASSESQLPSSAASHRLYCYAMKCRPNRRLNTEEVKGCACWTCCPTGQGRPRSDGETSYRCERCGEGGRIVQPRRRLSTAEDDGGWHAWSLAGPS
jgi:hypothetical protein